MRYLAGIAIAITVAGTGLALYIAGSLQQSTPTVTQLATRLAQSVDPFLQQSSG